MVLLGFLIVAMWRGRVCEWGCGEWRAVCVCLVSLCVYTSIVAFCVVYLPGIVSYQDGTRATGVTV